MCARSVYMYIRMVRQSPALHHSYTIHYNVWSLIIHNTFQGTKETAHTCSNVCVFHYTSVQHRLPHVQHHCRAIIKRPCSVTPSLHQPSKKNWQMRSLREKLESNMSTCTRGEESVKQVETTLYPEFFKSKV